MKALLYALYVTHCRALDVYASEIGRAERCGLSAGRVDALRESYTAHATHVAALAFALNLGVRRLPFSAN